MHFDQCGFESFHYPSYRTVDCQSHRFKLQFSNLFPRPISLLTSPRLPSLSWFIEPFTSRLTGKQHYQAKELPKWRVPRLQDGVEPIASYDTDVFSQAPTVYEIKTHSRRNTNIVNAGTTREKIVKSSIARRSGRYHITSERILRWRLGKNWLARWAARPKTVPRQRR